MAIHDGGFLHPGLPLSLSPPSQHKFILPPPVQTFSPVDYRPAVSGKLSGIDLEAFVRESVSSVPLEAPHVLSGYRPCWVKEIHLHVGFR